MKEGITAAHEIWASPAGGAGEKLRGVDYVMLCAPRGKPPFEWPDGSLRAALERGDARAFLEPVPAGDVFRLWRLR